jgi:predicted MFS family arabinose efflux permease
MTNAPPSTLLQTSLPPAFRRLAWSNLAAQSAEQIGLAAAPILAVLTLGADVADTGLLTAAQTLPFLLLSFPAGVLADRLSRRGLMFAAELSRAVALLCLPLLAWLGGLSVAVLAVIGFFAASGTVAFSVAAPALVPTLVPHGMLARANGRIELARSIAFVAGPALAGALVGSIGASPTFVLASLLSCSAALLLTQVPEPARTARPSQHFFRDLREGAEFVLMHPLLRPILLTAIVWNIAWFVLQAAFIPYAVRALGLTSSGIGATLACYGAGMVAGSLMSGRITQTLSLGAMIVTGPLVSVAAAIAMLATIGWPSALFAGLSYFLFGAGPILWTIGTTTLRQAVTDQNLLGRASALFMTANMGARPIGAVLGGLVGAAYGPSACIVVAALGFAIQAAIILASPVPRIAALPAPLRSTA